MKNKSIIIIGNGGAGIAAVKAARAAGFTGKIRMVSDTNGPAFNPMLAPYYLKGMISWDRCFPFGNDFYDRYNVDCSFGVPVASIDSRSKCICLENGSALPYDQCLIATGASPVLPPVSGLNASSKTFPLRTAAQAKALERIMRGSKKAVIMGASLVGVKLAEILRKKPLHVTLVDIADHILPQGSHPRAAAFLETYFQQKGIDVRTGCGIEKIEDTKKGVVCRLAGDDIEADFVAVCAGIRPNIDFLKDASITIDQAVCVDEQMRTNVKDIFAAGDVCQANNLLSGKSQWLGTWGNAGFQGRCAGLNMAGIETGYYGNIPQHISPFFDWTYAQIGNVAPRGSSVDVLTRGNPTDGAFSLLVYQNNVLVGANLINCTHNAGMIRRSILKQKNHTVSGESWYNTLAI